MLRWYDELRVFMADQSAFDAKALIKQRRAEREEAYKLHPPSWLGTATDSQLKFPYLNLWGFPDRFYQKASTVAGELNGIAGSPGVIEGTAGRPQGGRVRLVKKGDILVCQ